MVDSKNETCCSCRKISPRAIVLWEILFLLSWSTLLVIALWLTSSFPRLQYWLAFGLGALMILIAGGYLPALYRSIGYSVSDRLLVCRYGVFFRKQKLLCRDRIVYLSLVHLPPFLGGSFLIVASPGAKLRIPFLSRTVAERLAQQLAPAPKEIYR